MVVSLLQAPLAKGCPFELIKATVKLQKETKAHGRWYADGCGGAFAFELLGERWSALVVRELMFGGRRFSDIRAGLPGISAKALTERLEGLEAIGAVRRTRLPPPANVQIYELTEWGYRADEPLLAMCRWALAAPGWDRTLPLSPAALMMSLRALFDPGEAWGLAIEASLRIGAERFCLKVHDGRLQIRRGEAVSPDFALAAPDCGPLKRLIYGKAPAASLAHLGLELSGDEALADRFIALFILPTRA
jgi:DNA-binding HxlR family transcriptional regulator